MTKIILNGTEVEADPSKPLIHACHKAGVDVPHYCYHPGLSPVGSCRICQVEVQQGKMPARVMVACRTPVAEGMVVNTESDRAHQTRRECLEFLLKNHPLDCPICDKAGECDLQDYTFEEGQAQGRTKEPRRKLEKRRSLGETILLDEERCILCSRCVRFFEEVPKKAQLVVSRRGSSSVIDTFLGRPLSGNYQGNIADLCPVGALTLKPFRFQARVWNLLKTASTCAECSRGCSTTVEVLRNGDVKRFRPRHNEAVNGYWMCDTGRFAFGPISDEGRLIGSHVRGYTGLEPTDLDAAVQDAAGRLATHNVKAVIASPFITVEEARALKELAADLGAETLFVSPAPNDLKDELLHTGDPCPNRAGLEQEGFSATEPAKVIELLQAADAALLAGDRVTRLIGVEALGELPAALRLVVFDTQTCNAPAIDNTIGLPNHVERTGTWINVDGHAGPISAAKSPPQGVRALESLVQDLRGLLELRKAGV